MKILLITEDINIKNELNKVFDENSTIKLHRPNSLEKIKQILLKNAFDLIISDTKTNGLSGFDVLKLRNKYHQEVKFVFYSADKSLNTIKKAFKNNVDDYIIKPELNNLIKYINSLQKKDRASKKFSQNINKQKINITNFSDNFPVGIFQTDKFGRTIYVNREWSKISGLSSNEALGDGWLRAVHPDDREILIKNWKSKARSQKTSSAVYRFLHPDGNIVWVQGFATPQKDKNGRIIGYIGSIINITAQKNIVNEIEESKKQFRTLFERAADAIFIADIETGKILDANLAACTLLNKTKEQIIGLHHSDLYPPEISENVKEIFQDYIKQTDIEGSSKPVETLIQRNDGSTVEIEILASQINYKDRKCLLGLFRDISLRKKAEKEIRESERKLRSLIETTIEGICTTDANDIIAYVNPIFSKLLKYETDELIGKNFKDLISPNDLKNYCSQQELRKSGQSAVYEISLINKDKEVLWFIISATPVFDENGNFIGSFGMFTNITEKKIVEEAIKHSEQRFRSIWENSFDAMRLTNSDGIIIDVNDAFCRLFSKSKDEIIGTIFCNLYKDVDIDSYLKKFKENFKNNSIDSLFEFKIVTWNDEVKWVSLSNSFIYDSNGEKLLLSIFRDITTDKLAEEEIKKLYRGIEHSPVSILITDTQGVIEYVNPKFCEVSGYSLSEVLGMKPSLLKSGLMEKSFYKNLWDTITNGNVWQGEFLNKRKNGDLFWESALIAPVTDEEGKIINYIGIKEDITEKKMLFEQLILAKEKAEESNRLKSNFLANMSHELRTPLNGILGYAEILKEDSNDQIVKDYASVIFRSGRRLLETLNLILDYSKIESEKVEAKFEYQNIQFLLNEIYKLHLPNALKKKLEFNFESDFEELIIKTDVQIFNSIFNNLVNNAMKFTEKGSISIKVKKTIHNGLDSVCIIIQDTGIGISKEKQAIIWEPFRQLSEGKSRSHEGTGLGLAIVKNYVKILNGDIELESDLGKGSKFSIYFPC